MAPVKLALAFAVADAKLEPVGKLRHTPRQMTTVTPNLRPLDHLVFPTASLDVARARLIALGFAVAPVGIHPFGTKNCCVYLADGAFLEPLAISDGEAAEEAVLAGNVFVARDHGYRARNGDEGFSALVLGTSDAGADDTGFRRGGYSAGELLSFSRPFVDALGSRDSASFRLAFAADPAAPDSFFFTCERVNTPKADLSALERHANGVTGIARVILSAADPAGHRAFLEHLTGSRSSATPSGIDLKTANGTVSVLHPAAVEALLDVEVREEDSLRLRAVVFRVADLAVAERLFAKNNIAFERRGDGLVVAPVAGQGAHFIFEVRA